MASGEYVVGRDIDFQYAANAPAGAADVSTGSRKKSKKKKSKKKHASADPPADAADPHIEGAQARIEPLAPQRLDASTELPAHPAARPAASPPHSPQTRPAPTIDALRSSGSRAAAKRAQNQNVPADGADPAYPGAHAHSARSKQAAGSGSSIGPHAAPARSRHMAYAPDKDTDLWFTSSSEERERVREFWRQLPTQERELLGRLDKDQLFQRVRRQRRDCACTVCGGQREAVEEELEELYTMNYDKLKHYTARLLEGDTLFSEERWNSEILGAGRPRRRSRQRQDQRPSSRRGLLARAEAASAGYLSVSNDPPKPLDYPSQAIHSDPSADPLARALQQHEEKEEHERQHHDPDQNNEQQQHHQRHPDDAQVAQRLELLQQQQRDLGLKGRSPIERLYTQLLPSASGGPPRPLLTEIARAYKNMPLPDGSLPEGDGDDDASYFGSEQTAETWKRVTKTFQDLVLDHLMKASPSGDPKALADSQVLETLDKVVRAGRVDPGSLAGGIMGLADDLLRNDGKQFMDMYEQQQTKPGAEQVLQPLKQLYDNYRMAEGSAPLPDSPGNASQSLDGAESQDGMKALKSTPGFNLTVRVDAEGRDPDEEEDDEFEDAVEEEANFDDDEDLDDELDDGLDDYTDGYSEVEGSTVDSLSMFPEYSCDDALDDDGVNVDMNERKRLVEGYCMLRAITARVFEQRVFQAYREHVARERQQLLLEELAEEESRAAKEREQRKTKDKEKKKNKKALAKQQREEEQRLKQAELERAREEQRLKEEQRRLRQLELDRIKQEAHRRKIEERMARMELEAKQREAQERERDDERLRKEKKQAEQAESAKRERIQTLEREKQARDAAVRSLLEREKAEKEKAERKRKQKEKDRQDKQQKEREQKERDRLEKERQLFSKQSTPRQATPGLANADGTPKGTTAHVSSLGYSLQGLQNGIRTTGPQPSQLSPASLASASGQLNSSRIQTQTPDLQRVSIPGYQSNPPGLQSTPTLQSMAGLQQGLQQGGLQPGGLQPSGLQPGGLQQGLQQGLQPGLQPSLQQGLGSSIPTQSMQSLTLQQQQQQNQSQPLSGGFSSLLSQQPSPTLSSLWSTVPQQQPPQQQQSQKWNSWSPWSTTSLSEDRATPEAGRTPSPPHTASSPWNNGASMWATAQGNNLDDIRNAAQSCYESIVKDGLCVDGYVPSQVLYHATVDATGARFSQNDLYKALSQLISFECLRDDVGLITHVKIQAT